MGATTSGGSVTFQVAADDFIAALRIQAATDATLAPSPLTLPPRGVRQWVNLMVKTWKFLGRWRSHVVDAMPASIQVVIVAVDVVIDLIDQQNHPGPE